MHDCEYYQELMSRLLDQDLTAEEEASLREHVRTCPECLAMFATFTGMTTALREDLAEPPRDLAGGVMARIAEEGRPAPVRRRPARQVRRPRAWVRLGAAACLVLLAAGLSTVTLRGRTKSSAAETADIQTRAGAAQDSGQTMTASAPDGEAASDTEQMLLPIGEESVPAGGNEYVPQAPAPSPSPSLEPLPVYDAARSHIGAIDPENIPAFENLITDEGWAEGSFEYMLKVEYRGRTYAFATDDDGGLVWWEEPSTQPLRSPGTFAQLRELITLETPPLPQ